MVINLSNITFENDFYFLSLNDGKTIVFNIVNEDFLDKNGNSVKIDRINIEVDSEDGEYLGNTSSIIGLDNEYYSLKTDYKEYEGAVLTKDNMEYVRLEVADE